MPLDANIMDCLKMNLDRGMLTKKEAQFAASLLEFYEGRKSLTEPQTKSAYRLLRRVIMERDL